MLTEVKIDSIDVTSRLREWKVTEKFDNEVTECDITFSRSILNDLPNLQSHNTITIKRGNATAIEEFVFEGRVSSIKQEGAYIKIQGDDKLIGLVDKNVTYSYDGANSPLTEAKGSDIATDLIQTWGGMTADVVDTGSVLLFSKFLCNGTDILGRLKVLADTYDYFIRYDATTGKVMFKPKGYASSTGLVAGAGGNVKSRPTWVEDPSQLINKLTVKGAVQEVQDEEYFNGNGAANQTFTLQYEPVVVQAWENIAGTWTLKVPGILNSIAGTYDYTADKETKKITATDTWTPSAGGSNVKIVYTHSLPVPIVVEDPISQTTYNAVREAEKFFSDIQTVNDAELRGNAFLQKYSTPFETITNVKVTDITDYETGQLVGLTDNINNRKGSFVINQIVKQYPFTGDELTLGDKEWRISEWGNVTLERIRRIEEEIQKSKDYLIQIKILPHYNNFARRYMQAYTMSITGDGCILGHPDPHYSALGTFKLGSPFGAETMVRTIWPSYRYTELFMDTDFKGSGTTATWSTGALVFTGAQRAISKPVWANNNNINSATLTATIASGGYALSYYMRVDGTNWEAVTNGTPYTFTHSGTQLEWKIESSTSATVTSVKILIAEEA